MAKSSCSIDQTTDTTNNHGHLSVRSVFGIGVLLVLWHSAFSTLHAEATRGANITGVIMSEQGTPIAGYVNVFRLDAKQGSFVPQSECTKILDSDGRFNCASLPPGYYAILAYLLQCPPADPPVSMPKPPGQGCPQFIVYPANADDDPMSLLRVRTGDDLSVSIVVDNNSGYEMHIEPANEAGIDKLHLNLEVGGASIPVDIETSRNANKQFIVRGLPQAVIRLVENWYLNDAEHAATAEVNTTKAAERNVILAAMPSYQMFGHVLYRMSQERKAKEIACEDGTEAYAHRFTALIDEVGDFSASDVSTGLYHCTLNGSEGIFIKSISVGGRPLEGGVIDLRLGGTAPLTIEDGFSAARITGSIQGQRSNDSQHTLGIAVRNKESGIIQVFKTDTDGRFQIQGLAPGTYRLYGWADIDKTPYRSLLFLRHYDGKSAEISVDENSSTANVEVDCIDCNP